VLLDVFGLFGLNKQRATDLCYAIGVTGREVESVLAIAPVLSRSMLALSADSNGIRSLALRLADRGIWEAAVLRGGRRARHRKKLLYLTLLPSYVAG
jgi:hypothetical protein